MNLGTILTIILAAALVVAFLWGSKATDEALQQKADQKALDNVTRYRNR